MTIAFLDVQYQGPGARAACVLAGACTDSRPMAFQCAQVDDIAPYEPGAFYKRELPCLLQVLSALPTRPAVLVVDGYVWLSADGRPGLGAHLFHALGESTPVVGVAKTAFREVVSSARVVPVTRGESRRPLFVSAACIDLDAAADRVRSMAGAHRIPTLLGLADRLARSGSVVGC